MYKQHINVIRWLFKNIHFTVYMLIVMYILQRTSDGGNGNHSVSLPMILIKNKIHQMLPSSYISPLLVSIYEFAFDFPFP